MTGEIFYWVFNMSIVATVTGFVIMLLRLIRHLPKRMVFMLWTIPFIRFIVPIGFGSKYSLMQLLNALSVKTVVVYESRLIPSTQLSMTNSIQYAKAYFPVTYKTSLLEDIFNISSIVWIAVALLFAVILIYVYVKAMLNAQSAVHLKDNVYVSNKALYPAVYGIIKPKIIIPEFCMDDIDTILAHEKVHIKRGDNLWRTVGLITAVLHWFNPFVWLFLKCFLVDMELSCDEKVIKSMNTHQKKAYAHSLLNTAEKRMLFSSPFGGANISSRIKNILTYKKLSLFSLVCFSVLALIIFYTLLTNAIGGF